MKKLIVFSSLLSLLLLSSCSWKPEKEIVTKVEAINKSNTTLTKYSLEYINNLIKSICTESLNDTTYQQSGKLNEPELHRLMLEVSA